MDGYMNFQTSHSARAVVAQDKQDPTNRIPWAKRLDLLLFILYILQARARRRRTGRLITRYIPTEGARERSTNRLRPNRATINNTPSNHLTEKFLEKIRDRVPSVPSEVDADRS